MSAAASRWVGSGCCLSLALAACGGGAPQRPPDPRLALRPLAEIPEEQLRDRTVQRIEIPEDLSSWSIDAPQRRRVELGGEGAGAGGALRLTGGSAHWVRIPGFFDPREIDLIAIEVVAGLELSLRAGLGRRPVAPEREEVIVSAEDFAFVRAGEYERCVLDLRRLRGEVEPFDEIVLVATKPEVDWTLVAVELVERPLERWLPTPGEAPRLIRVGSEARRGVGLSARFPLVADRVVPTGGELAFSYGWPRQGGVEGGDARIVLRCEDDGGALLERSFELPADAGDWITQTVDLAAFAGRSVRTHFELAPSGEGEAVCALAEVQLFARSAAAPAVLLVTSDTHRADTTGVARSSVDVDTPNLDRLAAEGIYFEDCFSGSSITLPAHAAIFTSRNPRDTGVTDNQTPLSEDAETLAERFARAGYVTWAVASARLLDPSWSGLGQGFDRMSWPVRDTERRAARAVEQVERWLPEAEGRPLLVWLHLFDAHRPYAPPEPWRNRYYPADADPFDPSLPEADFPPPPTLPGLRDIEWVKAQYKSEVSYLDHELGRLFELPRLAAATIAVTSDHGENLGEHGIFWNHNGLYPQALRVPLILRYPGVRSGVRVPERVCQYDLGATLLAIAGLLDERRFPGIDLRAVADRAQPGREVRYAIASFGDVISINQGRWYLLLNTTESLKNKAIGEPPRDEMFERHKVELYDLERDPACERDLLESEFERARRLRARLLEWIRRPVTGLAGETHDDARADAMLEALGYGGGEGKGDGGLDPECTCHWCERFR